MLAALSSNVKEAQLNIPKTIGVLAHPNRPSTEPIALTIVSSLQKQGIETWYYKAWKAKDVVAQVQCSDLVVAIGGDGAMLHAARVCAPYQVPVLGLHMGRLGFLTEIAEPEDWELALERLLKGDYWIENRMMITAKVRRNGKVRASGNALNDVVISGGEAGTMIQADTYIDAHWATTYNSDALIIATPTGSTAYALAAGGPILPPDLRNILIVPTAAHLSMDRPIVLSEGSRVTVRPNRENRNKIVIMIDGIRLANLEPDDMLVITACNYQSHFIRLRERNYFYRSLLDRLEPRVNRSMPDKMIEDE